MKKRNRLLSSPNQSRIFKSDKLSSHKNRHILFLSFLAITGIFITSIVLATSEPAPTSQSKAIQLPLIGNEQTVGQVEPVNQPAEAADDHVTEAVTDETEILLQDSSSAISTMTESEQIERLHLEQALEIAPVAPSTVTDTSQQNDTSNSSEVPSELNWKEVEVTSGDNLSLIFPRVGLGASDVYNVAQTPDTKALLNLRPGQIIKFGLAKNPDSDKPTLEVLELQLSPVEMFQLSASEDGYIAETTIRDTEQRQQVVGGEIQSSLFVDAKKSGMSDRLILEMARIFGWDIDFALDIRKGDSFKVIYNENYLDDAKIADGEILAAEFTNRGKVFRAVRFTDAEGNSDYFTPDGESMRKAFTRTPVPISRISSGFNPNRLHPVLKTNRPHRGVDYAAPTGTPILATGDGKVDFVGNKGGYGRTIVLSHGGRYTTLFAHMSRYKSGIRVGQRVKQGDVIGYIGMSGLATGPHLHYEFRVNGVHKNPLTVELPEAVGLPEKYRTAFSDVVQPLLASLNSLEIPTLAALNLE